ncbi:MAG: phosphate/phosphite/phosphonate ABC transporter substrate-binding protein, partial [Thermodesulfobacteriota bacterium]
MRDLVMRIVLHFTCLLIFSLIPIWAFSAERGFSFAVPPYANPVSIQQQYKPLVDYLAQTINIPIRLTISPNYISHVMNLGRGKVDIAFVGPSPYVRAKDKFGNIELLAKFQMKESINDRVVIVARSDGDIKTLDDIDNSTFAFGDYQSFGSHFMPHYILNQHGLSLKALTAYDYVGSHDNVALSVLHGDFDAGGLRFDIFQKYQNRALRIIFGPVAISPHVLVCRSDLPATQKKALRQALLNLDQKDVLRAINKSMIGFA